MSKHPHILDPKYDPRAVLEDKSLPRPTRTALLRELGLYRKIEEYLGGIMRPDFENFSHEMVRRKYIPNAKHEAFFRSHARGRWICGGNRSGKTESGVREDVAFAIGFRPWFKRTDPDYKTPFSGQATRGRIFIEDWKKAGKENIVPKLYSVVPQELLAKKPTKQENGVEYFWNIKVPFDATGRISTIELVTNKSDVRAMEGWSGHWAHFDEPTRESAFTATARGLVDHGGYFWMTMTLLGEPWIYDKIVTDPEYEGDYLNIFENLYDPRTGSGFLTKENIEEFLKTVPRHELKTRTTGEPIHLSGMIFEDFSYNVHGYPGMFITKEDFEPPDDWYRGLFIDPGARKPHTVVYAAWSPDGELFIYDGFRVGTDKYDSKGFRDVILCSPGEKMMALVKEINKRPAPNVYYCDPAAQSPSQDEVSMYDELVVHFPMDTWPKVKDKAAESVDPLAKLMVQDPKTGKPRFFINKKLTRAIWELERYRWDEYRGVSREQNDPKPKPVYKDDDYVDCIMAAAMLPPPSLVGLDMGIPDPVIFYEY